VRARALLPAVAALLAAGGCGGGAVAPGDLAGWNVLLITIDTLRADRVGYAGYEAAETPVLDALADEGVVFTAAVAAAPVTLPSHATILTGLYSPGHGALDNGFYSLPDDIPTLATLLDAAGYETAAVVGAYVLERRYGLARGFAHYDQSFRRLPDAAPEHVERPAGDVTAAALAWLATRREAAGERPFFLWVHYFDPHCPYEPPADFRYRFRQAPYDGEIAYTDYSLGELLAGLREAGELERTLVVVVSDHGEALGDGGELTHGLLLRESTLRVPFLMSAPGALPRGRRVTGTVSNADVAPTVLAALGLSPPERQDGQSLLPAITAGAAAGRRVYSETRLPRNVYGWSMLAGVRDDRWAWVRGPRPELYDLRADPGETTDRHADRPDLAAELDASVDAVLARGRETDARATLTAEEAEALRALGYAVGETVPRQSGADPKDMLPVWHEIERVKTLLVQGRLAETVAGLDRCLARDPGNRSARLMRAQVLAMLAVTDSTRLEEAIRQFRELMALGAVPEAMGVPFAKTLVDAGASDEAEALLRELFVRYPAADEFPFNLGVLLGGQGRHEEALAAYEAAYRLNPDAVHVLANLARALSLVERAADATDDEAAQRAVRLLERAIALAENDDRPALVLAEVCLNFGREERAREELRRLGTRSRLHGITPRDVGAVAARLP
jgi:arylsulfatase A-like enzyme